MCRFLVLLNCVVTVTIKADSNIDIYSHFQIYYDGLLLTVYHYSISKLQIFNMELLQQSSSLFGSLKNAVLGNPVVREFTIGQQIASFGPGLLWKVFDGKKKSTGQVFIV